MVSLVSAGLPVGVIMPFAGALADMPVGFLHCDGSTINRNDFSALFAAIGVAWGEGDTATTYEIPDLRGLFLRGQNNSSGNDLDTAARTAPATGGNAGDNVGSFQNFASKNHVHANGTRLSSGADLAFCAYSTFATGFAAFQITSRSSGNSRMAYTNTVGESANETRPKNAYVNYIIKY